MPEIEDLLVNCERCHVTGMVDGERCPDCYGRGLVARILPDEADEADGGLERLKKPELVALAEERGIDASGTRAEILERLQAD